MLGFTCPEQRLQPQSSLLQTWKVNKINTEVHRCHKELSNTIPNEYTRKYMKFPGTTYGIISRYGETNSSNTKRALVACPVQTSKTGWTENNQVPGFLRVPDPGVQASSLAWTEQLGRASSGTEELREGVDSK